MPIGLIPGIAVRGAGKAARSFGRLFLPRRFKRGRTFRKSALAGFGGGFQSYRVQGVEIDGFSQLRNVLLNISGNRGKDSLLAVRIAEKAVNAAAPHVVARAKRRAPHLTGKLRRSLRFTTITYRESGTAVAIIGPHLTRYGRGKSPVHYHPFIEAGHLIRKRGKAGERSRRGTQAVVGRVKGTNYLERSLIEMRSRVETTIANVIADEVAREWSRLLH